MEINLLEANSKETNLVLIEYISENEIFKNTKIVKFDAKKKEKNVQNQIKKQVFVNFPTWKKNTNCFICHNEYD